MHLLQIRIHQEYHLGSGSSFVTEIIAIIALSEMSKNIYLLRLQFVAVTRIVENVAQLYGELAGKPDNEEKEKRKSVSVQCFVRSHVQSGNYNLKLTLYCIWRPIHQLLCGNYCTTTQKKM